jgi:hypothetical protein
MHQLMAETLDKVLKDIQQIKADGRRNGFKERPRWPMLVLRTPKGWICPKEIDGKRTEGYWRCHQVPMGEMHENGDHVRILEGCRGAGWLGVERGGPSIGGPGSRISELMIARDTRPVLETR